MPSKHAIIEAYITKEGYAKVLVDWNPTQKRREKDESTFDERLVEKIRQLKEKRVNNLLVVVNCEPSSAVYCFRAITFLLQEMGHEVNHTVFFKQSETFRGLADKGGFDQEMRIARDEKMAFLSLGIGDIDPLSHIKFIAD